MLDARDPVLRQPPPFFLGLYPQDYLGLHAFALYLPPDNIQGAQPAAPAPS